MYVRQLHDRVTGSIQHGPLTAGVPMGADLPIVYPEGVSGPRAESVPIPAVDQACRA
jgi:hypothetical protein